MRRGAATFRWISASVTDSLGRRVAFINAQNQAVASLQENNHLVLVDLPAESVTSHFSAGEVALTKVDKT